MSAAHYPQMLADIEVHCRCHNDQFVECRRHGRSCLLQAGVLQPQLLVQRTIALRQVAAAMDAMSSCIQQAAGVTIIDPWAE
jgi:hypothetical protein